jgi:hypothetical protein
VNKRRLSAPFLIQNKREDKEKNRENILLTSPIPGPPNTLINSLDDPPLSLIGMILSISSALLLFSPSPHLFLLYKQ